MGRGYFIVLEYVEHEYDISDALNMPGIPYEDLPILGPSIDEERLRKLYGQIADVLLQL